ncbi:MULTISPECIES: hypothetical protein [Aerosakkonema]|uniref:hypothetical protein n=1 Tax=Aerosakkonema TaxID=1246629 RepID=UPI0035B8602C
MGIEQVVSLAVGRYIMAYSLSSSDRLRYDSPENLDLRIKLYCVLWDGFHLLL